MTFFGEISEPSTRTAWEDWDDVVLQEAFPELHLQNAVDPPGEIDALFILEGRYFYDSVKAQTDLEHKNSIQQENVHLYKRKATRNYICIIKDYNLVSSSEIVELLKDYITNSTDVIAVLMKPLAEYQVAQLVHKDYVLRSITTSNNKSKCFNLNIPNLEQPNIISGVAAGAITWREIIDKPAVAVVCYTEYPDEQDIPELQALLEKFNVISHVDHVKRSNMLSSNLYI